MPPKKRKFKKTMLRVGNDWYPSGSDEPIELTPERLQHWKQSFDAMTSDEHPFAVPLSIPMNWDHPAKLEDALPIEITDENKVKNAAGFLRSVELADDGNALELGFEVHGARAIEAVENNSVQVSPVIIDEFLDSKKTKWTDIITHVDLVHHPVDRDQSDFVPVEEGMVACSLRFANKNESVRAIRMASGEFGDDDSGSAQPPQENLMIVNRESNQNNNPDSPTDQSGGDGKVEAIIQHFSELGVELPSDFAMPTGPHCDILLAALKTATKARQEKEVPNDKKNEGQNNAPVQLEKPDVQMMSLAQTLLDDKVTAKKEKLGEKLGLLLKTGRISPAEHEEYSSKVDGIKMSLNDFKEGKKPEKMPLEHFIESRESVPAGTFFDTHETRGQRMSVEVDENQSLRGGDDMTPEEKQKVVDWMLKRQPANS